MPSTLGICIDSLPLRLAWRPAIYPFFYLWMTCLWWLLRLVSGWPPTLGICMASLLGVPHIPISTWQRLAFGSLYPWYMRDLPISAICMASVPRPRPVANEHFLFSLSMISFRGRFPETFSTFSNVYYTVARPTTRKSNFERSPESVTEARKVPKSVLKFA